MQCTIEVTLALVASSHFVRALALDFTPPSGTQPQDTRPVARFSPVDTVTFPSYLACCMFRLNNRKTGDVEVLLSALADSIGVYYNATGDLECFSPAAGANNASSIDANNWNWQVSNKHVGRAQAHNLLHQLHIINLEIEPTPVEDSTWNRIGETSCGADKLPYIIPTSQYPETRNPIDHRTPLYTSRLYLATSTSQPING